MEYILKMSNDALDQKIQVLADWRKIVTENPQHISTPSVSLFEKDMGSSYVQDTPEVDPIPPAEIPFYYWNLTSLRVTQYLKKHPKESRYFSRQ